MRWIVAPLSTILVVGIVLFLYAVKILPVVGSPANTDIEWLQGDEYLPGDTISLFAGLPMDDGSYELYIVDARVGSDNAKVRYTDDEAVLKDVQRSATIIPQGGDMATGEMFFYLLRNDTLVFHAALFDDNVMGFQNERLGWAEFLSESSFGRSLEELPGVYWPIVNM